MRRRARIAVVIVGLTLSAGIALSQQKSSLPGGRGGEPEDLRLMSKDPNAGVKRFLGARNFGGRPIPPGAYKQAMLQWEKLKTAQTPAPQPTTDKSPHTESGTSLSGVVWKPIGPSPLKAGSSLVNGRVNTIAVHPFNPNVIYLGTTGGGVWSSKDGGASWTSWTDHLPMIAIGEPGAIAIDPNNTNVVFVGTSTAVNNTTGAEGNQLNLTQGIMESTDGGASWIVLGDGFPAGNDGNASQFAGQDIYSIIVDPANSSRMYLACSSGLYWSKDGGQNWTPGTNGGGIAQNLALDTSSPPANRVLFAGIRSTGIKESTDGGQTWTLVLSSATASVATALAVHDTSTSTTGIRKVAVALAPPASPANTNGVQVIYATIEGINGDFNPMPYSPILGIFQSTDQGATWSLRSSNAPSNLQCQCFYTNTIAVDPASPGDGLNDTVYWGGTNTFRSDDGGATFSDITNGIHADSHAWAFAPQGSGQPFVVFAGNDGGVWKSTDKGATWTGTGAGPATINAGGLQAALMYHMDIKRDGSAGVTLAALQDNGTGQGTGSLQWDMTNGGDGLDVRFATATPNDAFSINNGGPNHSGDSGGSWGDITGDLPGDQIQTFNNTLNVDPNSTSVLYFSGAATTGPPAIAGQLFQSQNGGTNWRNLTQFTAIQTVGPSAVAPANSNNLAVAVGANVYLSTNALASTVGPPSGVVFANITRNLPTRAVTRVAFDPTDPTVIYVTLSGFGGGHVFRTTIGGTSWKDLSPALDVPFNGIAIDGGATPTALYIGTDLGVIRSVDGGNSWTALDSVHFPNAPVTDLQINQAAGVLRASTFGRGAFDLAAATGPVIAINAQNGMDFGTVCAGDTQRLTIQVFNVGTQDLTINSVQRLFGSADFTVLPLPSTPVVISPDAEVDFTVQFTPTSVSGFESAQIRIASNDPGAPYFDVTAVAALGNAGISTVIADAGSFGNVCVGSFEDLNLTINNTGSCDLHLTGISSSSPEFQQAGTLFFPLVVAPGTSLATPIRFAPTTTGSKTAHITISSNDPFSPTNVVQVSGNAPSPDIRVTGSTDFGNVCAGALAEKTVSVCDVGPCDLHVTSVAFEPACPDFTLVNNPFPATVSPDSCDSVVIRFTPTSSGSKSCTLVIRSDDPDSPVISKTVTANTPTPSIDVPPDMGFPPTVIQSVGACTTPEPFPVSNTGTCPLVITNFAVTTDPVEYSLAALPSFPILLAPGEVVGDGDLSTVFAPQALDRDVLGALTVTYELDSVTHATTSVVRNVCGEGVRTGARVLVTAGGVPMASVEQIKLTRINANRNKKLLDTVDNARNLLLQTVSPAPPCAAFQFHREYGTVSNPIQLLPGSYNITVTAVVNGHRVKKTVGFDLNTCGFNPTIVVNF